MTRIVAGLLCVVFGLLLLVGYDADDYRQDSSYAALTTEEAVRVQRENVEKRQERDLHRISIAVSLLLGSLMIVDGEWRRRRSRQLTAESNSEVKT